MRARGANVADLAILVVAADDGVKPQTLESIKILQETETPFVVAINKIDKPNANSDRAKNDLLKNGVLLEGLGGGVSWQEISAKTGQGVNELLDLLLLAAEVEGLTYDSSAKARGVVIEAKLGSKRGIEVVAVLKDGILRQGDEIATPTASGRVKILENFLGARVKKLEPSSPALIIGFENLPQVGEEFVAGKINLGVVEIVPKKTPAQVMVSHPAAGGKDTEIVKLIIKADVAGSLEAISDILKAMPGNKIQIIDEGVGDITDGDVNLAISSGSVICGFKTKVSKQAETLAKNNEVRIISSEIIYELVKAVEDIMKEGVKEIKGELEILATFSKRGNKQVVGGRMIKGSLRTHGRVEVRRGEQQLGEGRLLNRKKKKKDVTELREGKEGGILIDSGITIEKGDHLIYR